MTKALIIGVTGQDGSLLAKNLLDRGIEVHGTFRRGASDKFWRINELGIREKINYHIYNVGNELAFSETVRQVQPDFVFSLAGESFTALSFEEPKQFMTVNIESAVEQLEAIRAHAPNAKTFFAGSSEVFGERPTNAKLSETSPFHPKTPYGVSKLTQYYLVQLYREKYGLHLYNGILFPHESSFRSAEFVTRKIVIGLTHRKYGSAQPLQLGDLSMGRDWGNAVDYVDWMYRLLSEGEPGEYVFGTGKNTSVENFLLTAAAAMDVDLEKRLTTSDGVFEYFDKNDQKLYAVSDVQKFGANRFSYGAAEPSKLQKVLGCSTDTDIEILAKQMVSQEIARFTGASRKIE
jgi:GDPmannose 4,6-dehydratase